MSEKKRRAKRSGRQQESVWISPRYSLTTWAKTPAHEIAPATRANRLLELADTSLDLWQMKPKKAKAQKAS